VWNDTFDDLLDGHDGASEAAAFCFDEGRGSPLAETRRSRRVAIQAIDLT